MLALGAMIAACGGRQAGAPGLDVDAFNAPPLIIHVEGSCEDVPLATHCWKELDNPADCYFRTADGDLKRGPVVWSGMCVGGIAEGPGVLDQPSDYEYPFEYTQEGLLQDGRKHGRLIVEGSYREGDVHGEFVRYSSLDGSLLAKGAYVNGEREGPWIESYAEFTLEGAYENGLGNGEWIVRHVEGEILAKGSYEDDIPQGLWTYRYRDGSVSQGAYLAGRRVGVWTVSNSGVSVGTLNYARRREGEVVDGDPVVRVEGRCGDLPLGFPCWKELQTPSGCYSWSTGLEPRVYVSGSRLTWTGECANGIAEGEGTFTAETATWTSENLWRLNEGYRASVLKSAHAPTSVFQANPPMQTYLERTRKRSEKGSLVAGRRNGEWTDAGYRLGKGYVYHYENGIRTRVVDKDWKGVVSYEMNYVGDEANGAYASRSRDGTLLRAGNYVDGKMEGHRIDSSVAPFGLTLQGAFANGLRNGEWTVTDKTGHLISTGSFADDEPHGKWT